MKKMLSLFLAALLAGIAIGIGGTVYLSLDNKIAGALLFTVGLYVICAHGLALYTGKIGYLPEQPASYLIDLAVIWAGNFAGTGLTGLALNASRVAKIRETAAAICQVKAQDSLFSLLLLGFFCGLLMYAAVDGYKKTQNPLILFTCVSAFILCGFEHCIADMFYFSMAGMWNPHTFLDILVITLGNSLGGVAIPLWKKTQA